MNREYKGNNKLLIGIVLSVLTYWLFAQSLLNIAPVIQKSLNLSASAINMGVSMSALFSGIFIVVAGGLADKLGRVKLTYIGLLLNVIGSILVISTSLSSVFIAGRIFQGLAAACIMPATMALITAYYEGTERQRAVSFWVIGSFGGSGLSSPVAGFITTQFGWRYVFILSIVVSILSFLLILGTPESKQQATKSSRFDMPGFILFLVVLISLNILISKGKEWGLTNIYSLGLLALIIVATIIFVKIENSKEESFIDFSLFKNKYYLGATVSNFLINATAGLSIVVNSYLQQGRKLTSGEAGSLSIGYLIIILITIRIGEKLLQKLGARKPMIIGLSVGFIGYAFMGMTFLEGKLYFISVAIGFVFFGLALGLYATPSTYTALSNVPADKVGIASGIYKMGSSIGGAIGIALSSAIYTGVAGGVNFTMATNIGLIFNAFLGVVALLSVIFILPKDKK